MLVNMSVARKVGRVDRELKLKSESVLMQVRIFVKTCNSNFCSIVLNFSKSIHLLIFVIFMLLKFKKFYENIFISFFKLAKLKKCILK